MRQYSLLLFSLLVMAVLAKWDIELCKKFWIGCAAVCAIVADFKFSYVWNEEKQDSDRLPQALRRGRYTWDDLTGE